jgi:hypothetical protein
MEKPLAGKRRTVTMLGIVVITITVILLVNELRIGNRVLTAAKKEKLANEYTQVQTAAISSYTEYSVYPSAPDNATLIRMLTGESAEGNQRRIAFISIKDSDRDAKGDLLDPWGTPVELSVTADGKLHARSAGPDKTFGTADDISGDTNLSGEK